MAMGPALSPCGASNMSPHAPKSQEGLDGFQSKSLEHHLNATNQLESNSKITETHQILYSEWKIVDSLHLVLSNLGCEYASGEFAPYHVRRDKSAENGYKVL